MSADIHLPKLNPAGHRGLHHEEPLLFELSQVGTHGTDWPETGGTTDDLDALGGLARQTPIGLPELSEPQVVRHFTRLSQQNYAIDSGILPLGSCTMKHNPRLNEKLARLPGLAEIHPLQPLSTVPGALKLIENLADWLVRLTGMDAVAMTPAAGAHGEMCGMMLIKAALEDQEGGQRQRVLVPESAHGTNPATAAALGYKVQSIPSNGRGRTDLAAFKAALGSDVAAVMLTNPNTCGLFEDEILDIAAGIHGVGGYFYGDGANFNAIVGRVKPAELGLDCMHINLHKTFSTPHGGGGPGSGPVVMNARLAPYAPIPFLRHAKGSTSWVEQDASGKSIGRLRAFHGQFATFVRAYAYMLSLGADGLQQASADAVLNANYLLARLQDALTPAYPAPCMHEALFSDKFLEGTGLSTLDYAKGMIDAGYHPMTMYFPLVVHGALLFEPTETESKATLDEFVTALKILADIAKKDPSRLQQAPLEAPRRRLDETQAARSPRLVWSAQQS